MDAVPDMLPTKPPASKPLPVTVPYDTDVLTAPALKVPIKPPKPVLVAVTVPLADALVTEPDALLPINPPTEVTPLTAPPA